MKKIRIGRTLPPAAAPIPLLDIILSLPACLKPNFLDNQFSHEVCQDFQSKYCFLQSSGKAALTLILLALKQIYPNRDQVILPAFTCYSVPSAVKRSGLKIKLCDLAPSSFDFDKEKLKEIIDKNKQNKKILCALPTHLFGCPADVTGIRAIVGPDIPIIEDAAQAMGETWKDNKLGTLGDIGFFSLGRGKALSTMEGGVIITNRKDLAERIKSLTGSMNGYNSADILKFTIKTFLTTFLQSPSLFWFPKALPFLKLGETLWEPDFSLSPLSAFHIKLARGWQKRLARHRRARKKNCTYWQMRLPENLTQVCCETDISMIRFPVLMQTREQRDFALIQSEQLGLGLMPAYPTAIHKIIQLTNEFSNQQFPQAEDLSKRLLTIPVHEYIKSDDNEKIRSLLKDCKELD